MMRLNCWGAVLVLVLWAGCSSAPPAPEGVQERKNRAADYLKFGRQAFQETHFDQALAFYLIAVDLNTAVDNEPGMAVAWNSVATAQAALGKTDEARAALTQAEALATSSGDRTLVLQVAVNLVQSDLSAGDSDAASQRLATLAPFPATAEGAALDHSLGTLEKVRDNLDGALAAFDRALVVNEKLGLKQEMATNHYMKASVLGRLGRWSEAQTELTTALALDKTMENTLGIGQDLRSLGSVALKLMRPKEAFDSYVRAYRLFQAAGLEDQQRKTLELLVPLAGTLGPAGDQTRYQALLDQLEPPRK